MGSGELSELMGKVHRLVMTKIADPVNAVFLNTPAGFQLNADELAARAAAFFKRRFRLSLSTVSFKAAATATNKETELALRRLTLANYIFAGPGSPTYTVNNWRDTPVFAAMIRRLAQGAHLVFASAAAIAMGRFTLPVYEIYKVGEEPHWVQGLDLLGRYGLDLTIMPHWNNTEGGTHDTRFAFVGEERLNTLESLLPPASVILGIDEYTACIVDLAQEQCSVMGAGQVTIRHQGIERTYPAGTSFALDLLRSVPQNSTADGDPLPVPAYAGAAHDLKKRLSDGPGQTEAPIQEQEPAPDGPEAVDCYVELLVDIRAQLRASKQWSLADELRARLAELGVILEDGPTSTTWRRVEPR
jgi:cyanophycinase-like exopeptidase